MTTTRQAGLPFDLPFLVRALDGDREVDVVPIDSVKVVADGHVRMAGRGERFSAVAAWRRAAGGVDRWDVEMAVTFAGDPAPGVVELSAGLVVAARLHATPDPHWLIPGLFYGANRATGSRARYPGFGRPRGADDPWTASGWGFRADRAATPVVFARDREQGIGLATSEVGPLGLNGLGFQLVGDAPELHLAFPYREEPVAYDGTAEPLPPDLPTHRWRTGERVNLVFRAYVTSSKPFAWAPILDDIRDELGPPAAASPVAWLDPERAAELATEGLLRWHVRSSPAVIAETAAFERHDDIRAPVPGDREAMHVGWLSGAPPAAALLAHGRRTGNVDALAAGGAVLDNIAANLAPCGTFWNQWTPEHGWTKGWTRGEDALDARTLAEAALFMLRATVLVEDGDARSRWRAAVASNLDFVVAHQRRDGAIPAAWHARTGTPGSWEGCAGLAWVSALVEGAQVLERDDYLASALRAGTYYARFLDSELLFGAPEDVDLGPTSEDGYVAVMAYVALAESAPPGPERNRWIAHARRAADWMLSFRYSWDVTFDPDTTLGRLGYRTRGMDQASPANQHLHTYGLVAVAETLRLGRLTGEQRLVDRSGEHFAAARQLVARIDGDFGARRGMVPERMYQTACFGPKGEIGRLSHAWCLGLLLWACEAVAELPELAAHPAMVAAP